MDYSKLIYLDHQATTPVAEEVLQKMLPYFREAAGNPHSSDHSVGWQSSQAVASAKHSIAGLIGADEDEIIFTSGATEANNLALLGLGRRQHTGERRRILVGAIEHKCVLAIARVLENQYGYTVEQLPVDNQGRLSPQTLQDSLDADVLAVSVMAVNNEIGTIQDINRLSEVVREAGAFLHCDAAQAPVAMDISGMADQVDCLSLSAHKMYGPQGIGALFVRRGLQNRIEPLIYGGGQQNGLRSGTLPVPLCVGMGVAAELVKGKLGEKQRAELRNRRDRFVEKLLTLPWDISLNGAASPARHPGNTNIMFRGFSAQDMLQALQPKLAASTGSACTSGIPEPSHVLRAIGLTNEEAEASVRFSLGFETSDSDIDKAIEMITDVLDRQSRASLAKFA
jgi:cysteine desulfurase